MDDGYDREISKEFANLRPALAFVRPYLKQVAVAGVALVMTAGITLSIGQGLRLVVDQGLSGGSSALLERSVLVLAALVVALTAGTFVRFYFVSWLGERVSADLRLAVFHRLIRLHPAFFEQNRPTEIQSRITTDTTLLQTVIGSSVSIALRNALMFIGGVALLVVSNLKLSLVVFVSVPLVVAPIVLFGRRVRRLSRSSQDSLADVGAHAGESLRHVKIVQSFNRQDRDEAEFGARVQAAFGIALRRVRHRALLIALVMLLVMSAIALMFWIGGQDVLSGRTSPGSCWRSSSTPSWWPARWAPSARCTATCSGPPGPRSDWWSCWKRRTNCRSRPSPGNCQVLRGLRCVCAACASPIPPARRRRCCAA